MLLEHDPGEGFFIDYLRDPVPTYDRSGEPARGAKICLGLWPLRGASLPGRGLVLLRDYQRRELLPRYQGHLGARQPQSRGGVTGAKSNAQLYRAMCELASSYQVIVETPAQPGRTLNKAKVEERVGFIQRRCWPPCGIGDFTHQRSSSMPWPPSSTWLTRAPWPDPGPPAGSRPKRGGSI